MKKSISLILLFLFICSWGMHAEEIQLRAKISQTEVWVGQKVILHIDVLARDGWAQLKKVQDVEINGAYLLHLETQGTRLNEMINSESYTGQRYEFMLFAQRAGKVTVPSVPVDVEIKTWGAGAGNRIQRMQTTPVEFTARTPPGAEGIRGLISTTAFTAEQTWTPETTDLKVGDAIKHMVIMEAPDVSGMAFAPLQPTEITGVGIYRYEPTVEDTFSRGDLKGSRSETITYVFERPGEVVIPDVELSWWDVAEKQLKHIKLPGMTLQVTGEPVLQSVAVSAGDHKNQRKSRWWTAGIIAAVLAVVLFILRLQLLGSLRAWKTVRYESEPAYFKRVRHAARSGDSELFLRETMRWLDRINDGSLPARLDHFFQLYGEQGEGMTPFQQIPAAYTPSDIKAFNHAMASARRRWQNSQKTKQADKILPELN